MREWFQYTPPGRLHHRLVSVDENDAVIGYGGYVHEAHSPDGHFTAWVIVDPDCRDQGIGSALWDRLGEDLKENGATRLVSDVLDNDTPEPGLCPALRFRHRPAYFQLRAGSVQL